MGSTDQIRYDLLAQDALRGVVRRVLTDVARDGLPGEHHFFIAFDTRVPGVRLSTRMREKYPEEMTIVLQHQFWDLLVTDYGFEVGLSFGGVPERLLVPFAALKGFFDPSVKFGLQFELAEETAAAMAEPQGGTVQALTPATANPVPSASALPVRPPVRGAASEPTLASGAGRSDAETPGEETPASEADRPSGGAEVVRLDVFRKK
ncbi:MAG: Stringent starvation protein B [Azorhizobium sp. 32-67-21]|nr:MAG: Stringent starvation protein B [Azorhizobium sp. 32-67-21]